MFEKFLSKQAVPPEADPKKRIGRPPLPDHLRKHPKRFSERHDAKGWVKRSERKRKNNGGKHYTVRRKRSREAQAKYREKTGFRYVKAYNATLRRKYIQNRSKARLVARRRGVDPDAYYQITYADWLLVWASTEDVWRDGRFYRPHKLQGNKVKLKGDCCWFSRIDDKKPFTLDNVCIRYQTRSLRIQLTTAA